MLDKSQVRTFGGRAAFIAFANVMFDKVVGHKEWDDLPEKMKEAWIAAAHEACMLRWIIENEKPGGVA